MRTAAAWPPPLRPGDRVGVAALSGDVDAAALARGLEALRALGYAPVPARNLGRLSGVFAGGDDERLDAFHELAADHSLAAILFARGGYGLMRLLPRLDWDLIARRPRAWVGYSDLTPFLLQVVERLGLVAFHGPMVAPDFGRGLDAAELASFAAALAGRAQSFPVRSLVGGDAEGVLLGGCLSLLAATLGTPWAPRLDGAIAFLEDVNEPLYRLDRMLTHLRLSGSLDAVHAIVAGPFGGEWEQAVAGAGHWHRETLSALRVPVAYGLSSGHAVPNFTLPLGAGARLDGARGELRVG